MEQRHHHLQPRAPHPGDFPITSDREARQGWKPGAGSEGESEETELSKGRLYRAGTVGIVPVQEGWNWMTLEVPSSPNHSMLVPDVWILPCKPTAPFPNVTPCTWLGLLPWMRSRLGSFPWLWPCSSLCWGDIQARRCPLPLWKSFFSCPDLHISGIWSSLV